MRIPVNNKTTKNRKSAAESFDREHAGVAAVAADMAGPSGADVTGGDVTPPQDAEHIAEEHNETRVANEEMEQQQSAGEVDTQTEDLKPSAAQPETAQPEPAQSESAPPESSPENEATAAPASATDELQAELEKTQAQLLHLAADFDNYKKMAARRETEVRERAVRGVLEEFLPVLDNFERAVDSTRNARDVESVKVGIEYILKQFQEALAAHGVQPIEAEGKPFDPLHHDALERVSGSEHPSGTIVEQTQRGYKHHDHVLRPSRVKVAE